MTVSTTESRIGYNGNGATTAFAFPYRFLESSDLTVTLVRADTTQVTQVLNTNYTVTGAGDDAGGTVTMIVPPATGQQLVIVREVPLTQETDYISGDPFPAESHERALDKLTMISQRLNNLISRSIRLSDADLLVSSTILPSPIANATLVWNATGTAIVNGVGSGEFVGLSPYMEVVLGSVDSAEALTNLGAAAEAEVAKLAGAQTFEDIITFTEEPVVPVATADTSPVRKSQIAPATLAPTLFVPATAVELSSGASATLSAAVPSWARELMVVLDSVSSDSTGNLSITFGDSGGIETTGYSGLVLVQGSTTTALSASFLLTSVSVAAAAWSGIARFVRIDSGSNSYWVGESKVGRNDAATLPNEMVGRKQLSGGLTTVAINVVSGAFDGVGRAQLFWR